jgi:shikimate dehydrogenase
MRVFGLIGFPLSHSYSADFFNSKFKSFGLNDHIYKLFPIEYIADIKDLLKSEPYLSGLNVTIPYKKQVIAFLDNLSAEARQIAAVNCISIRNGKLTGYNTDCFGFEKAYLKHIIEASSRVLVLGNGGASKAVQYVLKEHDINYLIVSRTKSDLSITYHDLSSEIIKDHKVIINTTSLGMFPNTAEFPPLNYQNLTEKHFLIDLIYNPKLTVFLKTGKVRGCKVYNGLPMFQHQANKAWELWDSIN